MAVVIQEGRCADRRLQIVPGAEISPALKEGRSGRPRFVVWKGVPRSTPTETRADVWSLYKCELMSMSLRFPCSLFSFQSHGFYRSETVRVQGCPCRFYMRRGRRGAEAPGFPRHSHPHRNLNLVPSANLVLRSSPPDALPCQRSRKSEQHQPTQWEFVTPEEVKKNSLSAVNCLSHSSGSFFQK